MGAGAHEFRRRAWPALALATLTLAVFWRVVFTGQGLSADGSLVRWQPWSDTRLAADPPRENQLLRDQYGFFNANEEFMTRWVRRGVWPFWNPDLAHGIPTIASIQNAEYYPTNLLLWPMAPFWSRGIRAILRAGVCLLGTYAFGRAIGMGRAGATLAAMSFTFCGFNVVWLSHPPTNVSFLLPSILWTLERLLVTGAFGWGAALTLFGGAALLGGHPPTVLHIAVPIAIWLAYRLAIQPRDPAPRLEVRRLWWRLAVCAIGSGLIGSAAILPWTEYLAQNPGWMAPRRRLRVLSWQTLAVWVVPDFLGNPTVPRWSWGESLYRIPGWNNYCERTGYVGVASLLLAGWALLTRPRSLRFLPWAVGLAVSLALIYDPPVVGALVRDLPGFRHVNNSKMLCVACFCAAMLAGLGCDWLLEGRTRLARGLLAWAAVSLAFAVLLFAVWPDASGWARIAAAGARGEFVRDCLWAGVPVLAVLVALALVRAARSDAALVLVLGVAAVDLCRFATGFNPVIPAKDAAPITPGIRYLQTHVGGARVLPVGQHLLVGNTLLRYGLSDVRGGDWVNIREYEYLLTGGTGHYDFGATLATVPDTLPALNVSHVVLPKGAAVPLAGESAYDGEVRILRIPDGMPRVALVHDVRFVESHARARALIARRDVDLRRAVLLSRGEAAVAPPPLDTEDEGGHATVTGAAPNEVRVAVVARRAGFVVLTDTFFPGWTCLLNGRRVPILRANVAFRAVAVPAGTHDLVFRYRPWRAFLGLGLAGATVVTIVAIGLGRRSRRPRPPSAVKGSARAPAGARPAAAPSPPPSAPRPPPRRRRS
jgi:hypothetical protein